MGGWDLTKWELWAIANKETETITWSVMESNALMSTVLVSSKTLIISFVHNPMAESWHRQCKGVQPVAGPLVTLWLIAAV